MSGRARTAPAGSLRSGRRPSCSGAFRTRSKSMAVPSSPSRLASTSARGKLSSGVREMRIATWNVNSLKARLEKVVWWLDRAKPDVLLMQETKLTDADAPVEAFQQAGYELAHHGEGRWNGVAIASRVRSEEHTSELQSPCNLVCRLLLEKKKNKEAIRLTLSTHM